jgi:hypothetical protein
MRSFVSIGIQSYARISILLVLATILSGCAGSLTLDGSRRARAGTNPLDHRN